MTDAKLPTTDSIQELAAFWDAHDTTEFDDELVESEAPVFDRAGAIQVPLASGEAGAVEKMAKAQGVSREELVRGWVFQNLPPQTTGR